jgi:hypothetical protein
MYHVSQVEDYCWMEEEGRNDHEENKLCRNQEAGTSVEEGTAHLLALCSLSMQHAFLLPWHNSIPSLPPSLHPSISPSLPPALPHVNRCRRCTYSRKFFSVSRTVSAGWEEARRRSSAVL